MKARSFVCLLTALVALLCVSACGAHMHTEVVDAAIAPTCTETGLAEGKHCEVCGEITVPQTEVAALPHTEVVDAAIAPTCAKTGLTEGKHCEVCGKVTVPRYGVAVVAHTEVATPAIAHTCAKTGLTEGKHCSVCGKITVRQTEVAVLAHTDVTTPAVQPTNTTTGLTEGKHCAVCGKVLIPQKVLNALTISRIEPDYGSITAEKTVIETNHLRLNIPANVYIPTELVENINIITGVMETVSGMSFSGNPKYATDLLAVEVNKITDAERELGSAYAYPGGFLIQSGDLLELATLVHEASHALQYNQSKWSHCTWMMEGISTYTTYKTQKYIEQHYPEMVPVADRSNHSISNYHISNYDELYSHSLEYWMDNTFEYSGNNNYSIGFRFMWYLDTVYGDYTKWITEYEKLNPFYLASVNNNMLDKEEQIKALKLAYGDGVLDGFYPWLKKNEHLFDDYNYKTDLTKAKLITLYPMCAYSEIWYQFYDEGGILYNDLYIEFDSGRHYLNKYKGKSTDGMKLSIDRDVTLELYSREGTLLKTVTSDGSAIDLSGVSYIRLTGSGTFRRLEVTGFENYKK